MTHGLPVAECGMSENVLYVDLDGTLAKRQSPFNPLTVGEPVPKMVAAVKVELKKGRTVKLFTARASTMDAAAEKAIKTWLKEQGLGALEITCEKKPEMGELWDDRARQVEVDTGNFITKRSARSDRLRRLWTRQGKCPKCGGLPDDLDGFMHGGAGVCSECNHQWLIPGVQPEAEKQAKEIVRKEVPRTDIVEHCPHCDHQFVEKGGPRLKRVEGQPVEDAEFECPACHGEIWMPLPTDEDLERLGGWLGAGRPDYIEKERARRDKKRAAREAKLQSDSKQAAVQPTNFLNTLQSRAGGVKHLPTTPKAPVEGYRNRDGQVLPETKTPQTWTPQTWTPRMALQPAYGDKWDSALQAARAYRASNPDVKYRSQLDDAALNAPTEVKVSDDNDFMGARVGYTERDGKRVYVRPGAVSTLRHESRHVLQFINKSLLERYRQLGDYTTEGDAYFSHPLELEARLPELNAAWVRRGGNMPTNPEEAMHVLKHYAPADLLAVPKGGTDPWWAPDYTKRDPASGVTPYGPTPAVHYKDEEADQVDPGGVQVEPIYDMLRNAPPDKRQQLMETMARMLPGLVAAPMTEESVKAASSLDEVAELVKAARSRPPAKFCRPENWDAHNDLSPKPEGCVFYSGANDWENGTTWMWVVRHNNETLNGDLVWVAINNPEGLDDEAGSEAMRTAKDKGRAAIKAWHAAAVAQAKANLPAGDEGPAHPDFWDYARALELPSMQPHVLASGKLESRGGEKVAGITDQAPAISAPKTGPLAIMHALKQLNLDEMREAALKDIKSGKVTKRDRGVKILQAIDGLQRTKVQPHQLMIRRVPIIPPQFRPFATMGDSLVVGAANELYQDLIRQGDLHKRTLRELGDTGAQLTRRNLLNSVRAAYGYGDPVSPKLQGRGTKGFLHQILGDSPKFGWVQRRLLSKPIDSVSRGVITVDPDLDMDQISIPEESAWEMYNQHVQRRLVQRNGMSLAQAFKAVEDRTTEARVALQQEMTPGVGRPVIYSRAPAWHKFNTVAGWPKMHSGDNIAINPYVTAGLNADFNGDQQVGKVLLLVEKRAKLQNRKLISLSRVSACNAETMTRKNIIPAFNPETHTLHLLDLEEFPRGELRHHKTDGRNGEIFFYHVPKGTMVVAYNEATGEPVWAEVVTYSVHPQRVIELVDLANGRQILTDDDPRAVYGFDTAAKEWELLRCTPAEALQRQLVVPCVRNVAGACRNLNSVNEMYIDGVDEPLPLDWDTGWLLGAIAGDGWWDKKQHRGRANWAVYLSDSHGFNASKMLEVLRRLFGKISYNAHEFKASEHEGRYGDTVRHTFCFSKARFLCKFLSFWLGGEKTENSAGSATKSLPDVFLLAPEEFRRGLLCGVVDTDGSISVSSAKGKPQLMCAVTSTSIRLASDVKFLALTLGINASLSYSKTTMRGNTSWIVTLSAADCKQVDVFSRLITDYKRKTFINTPVCLDNTSLMFDRVVVPERVWRLVLRDLTCPKLTVEDRKLNTKDVHQRKHRQNLYQLWYKARKDKTISRDSAVAVIHELELVHRERADTISRAIEDLKSANDVVTPERVALWREAIRAKAPRQDTLARYTEGSRIYARTNRPLKEGRAGQALRSSLAAWLTAGERYTVAVLEPICLEWIMRVVNNQEVAWAVVTGVQKTGIKEDGYDLTVPGYETFMSADGVILSNTINISVPVLPDSVEEAKQKLMPSRMRFSIRDQDTIMGAPKHEQILGLYTSSSRPSGKVHKFGSKSEAEQAVRQGKVDFHDDVEFPG